LDLGYRGVKAFGGDERRAVLLHNVFHVLGVLVLALIFVAISVRIP
jgi:hypothetical protein